jgi:outer membrane protein, heavy metal efflux system
MRRIHWLRSGALAALFASGCQSAPPTVSVAAQASATTNGVRPRGVGNWSAPPLQPSVRPIAHVEPAPQPPAPAARPSSLDELLALARSRNPDVAAAVARVAEAQGRMVQAGLYPNPTAGYSAQQINDGPGTAGQQGGFVSQEFVTAGKLKIAREAARYGVTAADWRAASQWYDTAARVRAAYYEYAAAVAVLRETERMAALFEEGLTRTEKLAAGGRVESYDVSRLKVEVTQTANRVGNARQRVAAAERLLAVAVGADRLPDGFAAGAEFAEVPGVPGVPAFEVAAALAGGSSFVQAAAAEVNQAEGELRLAELKPIPNVHTVATLANDATVSAPVVSVQVGVPLPLWDRNQGNIATARARLATATAGVEQARLRAVERLTNAYQRYENARRQLELYRTKVLPDAAAALEQIDKVYEAKGERFFDTLDARRVLSYARIDYAQALGELWAAVAEIEAVAQPRR